MVGNFKILLAVLIVLQSITSFSQNNYILGNVQVNQFFEESTFPSSVGFQFSSRVSINYQTNLLSNPKNDKELISLAFGLGNFFNSLYFKDSNLENPKRRSSFNIVDGSFIEVEPILYLFQNKSKNLSFHFGLNNVLYIFPYYESNSGYFNKDDEEIRLLTNSANNKVQYSFEPNIGLSYVRKFKGRTDGLLLRFKVGKLYNSNYSVAQMRLSDQPSQQSKIKLNKNSFIITLGYLLKSKQ